jgi:hypothetical protein
LIWSEGKSCIVIKQNRNGTLRVAGDTLNVLTKQQLKWRTDKAREWDSWHKSTWFKSSFRARASFPSFKGRCASLVFLLFASSANISNSAPHQYSASQIYALVAIPITALKWPMYWFFSRTTFMHGNQGLGSSAIYLLRCWLRQLEQMHVMCGECPSP